MLPWGRLQLYIRMRWATDSKARRWMGCFTHDKVLWEVACTHDTRKIYREDRSNLEKSDENSREEKTSLETATVDTTTLAQIAEIFMFNYSLMKPFPFKSLAYSDFPQDDIRWGSRILLPNNLRREPGGNYFVFPVFTAIFLFWPTVTELFLYFRNY